MIGLNCLLKKKSEFLVIKSSPQFYQMDLVAFKKYLSANEPPTGITVCLKAMWYDAKGNWDKAHKLIQDEQDWFYNEYFD